MNTIEEGHDAIFPAVSLLDQLIMTDHIADDHRPLGEQRASPPVKKGILFEMVPSHYPDSRGHQDVTMNITALREMTRRKDELFKHFGTLHDLFVPQGAETSLDDLVNISVAGMTITSYRVYGTQTNPELKIISPALAQVYKASAGIAGALVSMEMDSSIPRYVTPTDVYTYADQNNILFNKTRKEGCAAPRQLIVDSIEAMMHPETRCSQAELSALIPHPDRFVAYTKMLRAAYEIIQVYLYEEDITFQEFNQAVVTSPLSMGEVIKAITLEAHENTPIPLTLGIYYGLEQKVLNMFTKIQTNANLYLGRIAPRQPVTVTELRQRFNLKTPTKVNLLLTIARGTPLSEEERIHLIENISNSSPPASNQKPDGV